MTLICIEWEGPISVKNAVKRLNRDRDIGLYQLYGRHPIFGRDSFLYIGKTTSSFANRIADYVKYQDMKDISHKKNMDQGCSWLF